MEKRAFKEGVYGGIAQMTKALSNPHRLEIIDLLAQGEKTVESISSEIGASIANASQHLQVLKNARLVSIRKEGHYSYYRLTNPEVFQAWQSLRTLSIAQIPEVNQIVREFRTQSNTLQAVSMEELFQKLELGEVVLLDVRPRDEYQRGHIPGAISLPPTEWQQLPVLPKGKAVVAYCRGPFCVFADEAVTYLKSLGYQAIRLEEGFPDWKLGGFPVAMSN